MDALRKPAAVLPGQLDTAVDSYGDDFTDVESLRIVHMAERDSWQVAAHDGMRSMNHRAYRLAIDEYRSQIRCLLPLGSESHVLHFRSDWGAVPFNLAAHSGQVVTMDDRHTRSRFVAARQAQAKVANLHAVSGSLNPHLPFGNEVFDAVIVLDALENLKGSDGPRWRAPRQLALSEVLRVLKKNGCALVGASNRFGIGRASHRHRFGTYPGYRAALQKAGFSQVQFYAALPSHRQPYFLLPLNRRHPLNFFANKMFTAQDYRSKVKALGLDSAYRLAFRLQRVAQSLRLMGLARYFFPSYLIVAQK